MCNLVDSVSKGLHFEIVIPSVDEGVEWQVAGM
jgi:hypothetical protein